MQAYRRAQIVRVGVVRFIGALLLLLLLQLLLLQHRLLLLHAAAAAAAKIVNLDIMCMRTACTHTCIYLNSLSHTHTQLSLDSGAAAVEAAGRGGVKNLHFLASLTSFQHLVCVFVCVCVSFFFLALGLLDCQDP